MLYAATRCLRQGLKPVIGLALCCALVPVQRAWAQADTARIQGSVLDPSGAAVPGATITVTNRDTNAVVTVTSDGNGNFAVPALTRGSYEATATDTGFTTAVQDFTLDVSQAQTLKFTLQPGAETTSVTVTDAAPLVETASSSLGLLATLRGMPEIYSGDEIAMEGGDDPDNRRDFPGGFPGDAHNAFTPKGRTVTQNAVHDWVRDLLMLRRAHPALQGGKQQDIFVDDTAFAFVRTRDLGRGCSDHSPDKDQLPLLVVINNSDKARNLLIRVKDTALGDCSEAKALFNTHDAELKEGTLSIALDARQIAVYEVH